MASVPELGRVKFLTDTLALLSLKLNPAMAAGGGRPKRCSLRIPRTKKGSTAVHVSPLQ